MTKQSISKQNIMDCHEAKASRNDGFTLAEVLITLVIIGVIAAITVPTLITKYQKEQTVTKLKKAYSTLAQTTNRAITDNGPINTWEMGQSLNTTDTKIFLKKYVEPYISILKESEADGSFVKVYLADGSTLRTAILNSKTEKRLQINVDINGNKKPNIKGKDIFEYNYYLYIPDQPELSGKILPFGALLSREELLANERYMCNKEQSSKGACAALIMKDGWRIADDYPW